MKEDIVLSESMPALADDVDDLETFPVVTYAANDVVYQDMPIYTGFSAYSGVLGYLKAHAFEMTQEQAAKVAKINLKITAGPMSGDGRDVFVSEASFSPAQCYKSTSNIINPGSTKYYAVPFNGLTINKAPFGFAAAVFTASLTGVDGKPVSFQQIRNPSNVRESVSGTLSPVATSTGFYEVLRKRIALAWGVSKSYLKEQLGVGLYKGIDIPDSDFSKKFGPHILDDVPGGRRIDFDNGMSIIIDELNVSTHESIKGRIVGCDSDNPPYVTFVQYSDNHPAGKEAYFAWRANSVKRDSNGEVVFSSGIDLLERSDAGSRAVLMTEDGTEICHKDTLVVLPYLRDAANGTLKVYGRDEFPPEYVRALCVANKEWNKYWGLQWAQN